MLVCTAQIETVVLLMLVMHAPEHERQRINCHKGITQLQASGVTVSQLLYIMQQMQCKQTAIDRMLKTPAWLLSSLSVIPAPCYYH